jgi:ferritin-like metal-binding protein YciE
MSLDSLDKLFLEELKDVYNAEKQIVRALPKMAKAADSPELQQAFTKHLRETEGQVQRLEQIFQKLGQAARGKKCKGMEGLLEEGKEVLEEKSDATPAALDAALIAAAQRVEHYEIAAYGTVCTYAKQLGNRDALELLKLTMNEEQETDKRLSQIAAQVNLEAAEGPPPRATAGKKTRTAR